MHQSIGKITDENVLFLYCKKQQLSSLSCGRKKVCTQCYNKTLWNYPVIFISFFVRCKQNCDISNILTYFRHRVVSLISVSIESLLNAQSAEEKLLKLLSWTSCLNTWHHGFYQIPTDKKNQQVTDSVRNLLMSHVWIFQPDNNPNTNFKNNTKMGHWAQNQASAMANPVLWPESCRKWVRWMSRLRSSFPEGGNGDVKVSVTD